MSVEKRLIRINNCCDDLSECEYDTFSRSIINLYTAISNAELDEFNNFILKNVNFDTWISDGMEKMGGLVGSGELEWPKDIHDQLGLILGLIKKFSEEPGYIVHFSHCFCYSGTKYDDMVRKVVQQYILPFCRDYIYYASDHYGNTIKVDAKVESINYSMDSIFIVHGHNNLLKQSLARVIERQKINAVILHEQANSGLTIIEKFEKYSDVHFAIVLLTPDDHGNKIGSEPLYRARQNVIFELGYFIGKLGRNRVVALKEGNVEIPSDISGFLLIDVDGAGAWKTKLCKELTGVGFPIDYAKIPHD